MERLGRVDYYLNIAKATSNRATCLRARVGAVLVSRDVILSTGYNGAARGMKDCLSIGRCKREEDNIPSGERYESCMSVHAELNACLQADYVSMEGAALYLYFDRGTEISWTLAQARDSLPCMMCKRILKNCRIGVMICQTSFNITDDRGKTSDKLLYEPSSDTYALLSDKIKGRLDESWSGSAKMSSIGSLISTIFSVDR